MRLQFTRSREARNLSESESRGRDTAIVCVHNCTWATKQEKKINTKDTGRWSKKCQNNGIVCAARYKIYKYFYIFLSSEWWYSRASWQQQLLKAVRRERGKQRTRGGKGSECPPCNAFKFQIHFHTTERTVIFILLQIAVIKMEVNLEKLCAMGAASAKREKTVCIEGLLRCCFEMVEMRSLSLNSEGGEGTKAAKRKGVV